MPFREPLSCKENEFVEELWERIKKDSPPKMYEDTLLLHKFLVARDYDVDKAEKMLRKNIAWRKAHQIDNILKEFKPQEFYLKYVVSSDVGLDKEGDMIRYAPWGKIDGRDVAKCSKANDYLKNWIWSTEDFFKDAMELGKKGNYCAMLTAIIDLENLSFGNATCKESTTYVLRLLSIIQDNYPEGLKSLYVINAPSYYIIMFSIAKAMMSSRMIQKIHVYGSNGWKEKLLEVIDADVLPAFLGGKRTDPDGNPLCRTFINHGGKIPEIYHLPNEDRYFKCKDRVKQIVVPQKEKEAICLDVTKCGSVIRWEFLVKSRDIGFGFFKKLFEEDLEEVLPIQRYDTIDGTEVGSYKCQSTGKYVIVFDNTYSWMWSKEIEYLITVVKP